MITGEVYFFKLTPITLQKVITGKIYFLKLTLKTTIPFE